METYLWIVSVVVGNEFYFRQTTVNRDRCMGKV